jgi:hypothetical protein
VRVRQRGLQHGQHEPGDLPVDRRDEPQHWPAVVGAVLLEPAGQALLGGHLEVLRLHVDVVAGRIEPGAGAACSVTCPESTNLNFGHHSSPFRHRVPSYSLPRPAPNVVDPGFDHVAR